MTRGCSLDSRTQNIASAETADSTQRSLTAPAAAAESFARTGSAKPEKLFAALAYLVRLCKRVAISSAIAQVFLGEIECTQNLLLLSTKLRRRSGTFLNASESVQEIAAIRHAKNIQHPLKREMKWYCRNIDGLIHR